MMKIPVLNLLGEKISEVELLPSVFGSPLRIDIIDRVVQWQRAKARSGNHATKTISDVAGSGKKVYKQKGTGNARRRTNRATQFRGGGIVFGPVVRDHGYGLPKKVRALGMRSILSQKFAEGNMVVVDFGAMERPSTKTFRSSLAQMGCENALIVLNDVMDVNVARSAGNIPHVDVLPSQGLNVYSVVRREKLLLTVEALSHIHARYKQDHCEKGMQ